MGPRLSFVVLLGLLSGVIACQAARTEASSAPLGPGAKLLVIEKRDGSFGGVHAALYSNFNSRLKGEMEDCHVQVAIFDPPPGKFLSIDSENIEKKLQSKAIKDFGADAVLFISEVFHNQVPFQPGTSMFAFNLMSADSQMRLWAGTVATRDTLGAGTAVADNIFQMILAKGVIGDCPGGSVR